MYIFLYKYKNSFGFGYATKIELLLNILNCFSKIKEAFTVKLKMISADHYIRLHQTPKNVERIFQKTFYAKRNGALSTIL
jgi:hypothetical protein